LKSVDNFKIALNVELQIKVLKQQMPLYQF
jgi:hypothetical protein